MQSTTNYSMNLVEGTDIVNVPVQLNPNFQTIDQEMFANKQGTIGTATEVVTGTVHAIVRANTDADMFRFTATGPWTSGDTMTLDGSAVTVHLADGTAPATGAYIIGAEVVAVVNGTLVTLLTSAAQPVAGVTSFNSRTGAVVPTASDYDAADIDYDNTISGLTSTDVQSAIDELATATPSGVVELWSNPNPGSSYAGNTPETLDTTGYSLITYEFCEDVSAATKLYNSLTIGADKLDGNMIDVAYSGGSIHAFERSFKRSGNAITFYGGWKDGVSNNSISVPQKIYGIK